MINARKEDAPVILGAEKLLVVCCHEPLLRDPLEKEGERGRPQRDRGAGAGSERPRELTEPEEGDRGSESVFHGMKYLSNQGTG